MNAQMTAKMVIASLKRLMLVRHFCRNRNRMAEINVPAWPMPIQNTKGVMRNPPPTGKFAPHPPAPVENRYGAPSPPPQSRADVIRNAGHHQSGWPFSVISPICSESFSKLVGPHTRGMRGNGSANRVCSGSFAPAISYPSCAFALMSVPVGYIRIHHRDTEGPEKNQEQKLDGITGFTR